MQADPIDVVNAGTSEVNGRYKLQKGIPKSDWWTSGTRWYKQVDRGRYCIYFCKAFDGTPDRWYIMQDEFVIYFADGSAASLPPAGWQVATGRFARPGSMPAPTIMQACSVLLSLLILQAAFTSVYMTPTQCICMHYFMFDASIWGAIHARARSGALFRPLCTDMCISKLPPLHSRLL